MVIVKEKMCRAKITVHDTGIPRRHRHRKAVRNESEFRRVGDNTFLYPFMEDLIERMRICGQEGTARNYKAAMRSFCRFREGDDIGLSLIDKTVMEEYQTWLRHTGLSRNSISFYMRILRAVYNRAVSKEMTINRNPFLNVFTGMEKTRKRAVPQCEIIRLRNLDLSHVPKLEFARDMFLFLFLCRGMSFIDAVFLKKTDLRGDRLSYRRHKTGQSIQIKVIKQIRDLLERYHTDSSPYLLPFIKEPETDERRQYESALRRINKALGEIGEMAGMRTRLTTYVSRHSWATIAKTKNIPINVISDALGHDSIATTQIYLSNISNSVIDRANELVTKGL